MKQYIYIVLISLLSACSTNPTHNLHADLFTGKSIGILSNIHSPASSYGHQHYDSTDNEIATYYVVVADTGIAYYNLHKKMFHLNEKLNIAIDTMGRFYNKSKNLIALPDNDPDEIYAGNYFPRRFPSENLSLEYLYVYQHQAGEKTIALVTGIYETAMQADSALSVISKYEKNAFTIKANIYVGCLH
jgi:hypothetical protein